MCATGQCTEGTAALSVVCARRTYLCDQVAYSNARYEHLRTRATHFFVELLFGAGVEARGAGQSSPVSAALYGPRGALTAGAYVPERFL